MDQPQDCITGVEEERMDKPVILTVDDDAEVLQAIARDVRREYGERFRVMRVDSGRRALEVVRQLKLANESVALMLVDQRMPEMTGVEFLQEARQIFPDAKRALLTAYADTEAAIRAINDVRLDHYLMKPWDPPEKMLYPVLDELLDDWLAGYRPPFDGIRIVGHRWSAASHAGRDFLARNQVPYRWFDLATDPAAKELAALARPDAQVFPLFIFADGSVLENPSLGEVAEKAGLRGRADTPFYDVVIIGAGPAGLAAAVYAASDGLRTVIVERRAAGGQAGMSARIENYLGFPSGLSGDDLTRRAVTQARRFGTDFLLAHEAVSLTAREGSIGLALKDGPYLTAHSLIIATGVSYRRLEVPGVEALTGRGVYYGAALSEAGSLKGEDVYVVGGANSAGQAAVHFADFARHVTLLVRGASLYPRMSHYLVERIEHTPNIEVRYDTVVDEAIGEEHLEALRLKNTVTEGLETVRAAGLFVFIGAVPPTDWLEGTVCRDSRGFIVTGPDLLAAERRAAWGLERDPFLLETSVPGVFAAGDVRQGSGKRVATAVGEGAMAAMSVWRYRLSCGL
jgi:thioredoxin reductase (NADPH)